jgi:hypothetical protein
MCVTLAGMISGLLLGLRDVAARHANGLISGVMMCERKRTHRWSPSLYTCAFPTLELMAAVLYERVKELI